MQISATTPVQPITPVDHTANSAQTQAKAAAQAATTPKVFTPAPPLRPNVQDFVDIDRTLINLRQGT